MALPGQWQCPGLNGRAIQQSAAISIQPPHPKRTRHTRGYPPRLAASARSPKRCTDFTGKNPLPLPAFIQLLHGPAPVVGRSQRHSTAPQAPLAGLRIQRSNAPSAL